MRYLSEVPTVVWKQKFKCLVSEKYCGLVRIIQGLVLPTCYQNIKKSCPSIQSKTDTVNGEGVFVHRIGLQRLSLCLEIAPPQWLFSPILDTDAAWFLV